MKFIFYFDTYSFQSNPFDLTMKFDFITNPIWDEEGLGNFLFMLIFHPRNALKCNHLHSWECCWFWNTLTLNHSPIIS